MDAPQSEGQGVARAVAGVASAASALASAAAGCRSVEDALAVVGGCQEAVNRLTAVQDDAITRVARSELVTLEDGTEQWVDRGPGRVVIGAADLVAPGLGASHHQAQRRVELAVRVAAGREPTPLEVGERPERTGLEGLHRAMHLGRLDSYRASVVAFELDGVPADVAAAVVDALGTHLSADAAPALRRRTRRLLARVSPDLLRQRVARARSETGLQRWVEEPGVDVWHGRFPSEDAAAAWAAVDALARRYVRDGACATLERARGKALTDLVTGRADVDVQVVLTVPADGFGDGSGPPRDGSDPQRGGGDEGRTSRRNGTVATTPDGRGLPAPDDDRLVLVQGSRPSEPVLVPAGWLARHTTAVARAVCHPDTGARIDPRDALATDAYRAGPRLVALVRARDGRCRFPGCAVAARSCDLDHVRPWPAGATGASNLLCLCRRHHRLKQALGWAVRLHADGRATWTDPTGRRSTTEPLDALDRLVLPADTRASAPRTGAGRHHSPLPSSLEEALDHRLAHVEAQIRHACRFAVSALRAEGHGHHRRRRRQPVADPDPPPF